MARMHARSIHYSRTRTAWVAFVLAIGCVASGRAATPDYGRLGEAVHLRVGYQPYYSEAWSAVLIREFALHSKYLPKGSTVAFDIGTKGGVVLVNAVLSGRHAVSYLGAAPTAEVLRASAGADVRVVAAGAVSTDQCGLVLARAGTDAPNDLDAAVTWLDGKRVGVPFYTCAEQFLNRVLAPRGVTVTAIDQNIDVLAASLASNAVDAVSVWEPMASELVLQGLAVPLVTGGDVGYVGGAFVVMRGELISERPDVALAWVRAERDAQALLADPTQRDRVVAALAASARSVSAEAIRAALDRRHLDGGARSRMRYPFVPERESLMMLTANAEIAASARGSSDTTLRSQAIEPRFAEEAVREAGPPERQRAGNAKSLR
jgi:NitT/TauT family transport system substrate-binding protein